MTETVNLAVNGGVALVKLNRPEQLNCLDTNTILGLQQTFEKIHRDPEIKAAVLTGTGKAFCAGLDLKALSQDEAFFSQHNKGQETGFIRAISDCSKPVIGAINGVCVAGGLELALCCDFLYASDKAAFADTHAFVGVLPGWGLSQKFPRIVGVQRAKELSFSGRYFSADEAKQWGLVNEVFDASELIEKTLYTASKIAEAHSVTLYKIKQMVNTGWKMPLKEALVYESNVSVPHSQKLDVSNMEERLQLLRKRR